MKKAFALILFLSILMLLCACGKKDSSFSSNAEQSTKEQITSESSPVATTEDNTEETSDSAKKPINSLDKALLIHLAIQIVFAAIYLCWQFEKIDIDEEAIRVVIAILNIIETVLLIMTRFMEYGSWGVFALGTWYVLNTIILVMQFVLADWGWRYKVQDVLWIALYVHLFCLDVVHVNLIAGLLSKYSPALLSFGEKINGTFWGDLIKAVLLAIVKGVINIFATIKAEDE